MKWTEETNELVGFFIFQGKYKKLKEDSSPSASSAVHLKFNDSSFAIFVQRIYYTQEIIVLYLSLKIWKMDSSEILQK